MMTKYYILGVILEQKKDIKEKLKKNLNKVRTLVNNNASVFVC